MGSRDLWNIFENSGSILDYLNYTACTAEKQIQDLCHNDGEDAAYGSAGDRSWNGFVGNAGGGE